MSLESALRQHYATAGTDQEQLKLKRMYEAQQSVIGKAAITAQRKLVSKMQDKGIYVRQQEAGCMTKIKTGEKRYYLKG